VEELIDCTKVSDESKIDLVEGEPFGTPQDDGLTDSFRLADAPQIIHSYLDIDDVHGAASFIIQTFQLMTKYTHQYPLANSLTRTSECGEFSPSKNAALLTQIKMVYLHLQSIPLRILQISKNILLNMSQSCSTTARALSALHLLNVQQQSEELRANKLMDLYFDSKAKLLHTLLDRLSPESPGGPSISSRSKKVATYYTEEATDAAEKHISEILLILQYDIILYPYQIFVMRKHSHDIDDDNVSESLPEFDKQQLTAKVSNFLAAHLPLIRSKVKTILVGIAGTTASRLGHMRQSLYDKTDGAESLEKLSSSVCTWDDAIKIIDVKVVMRALEGLTTSSTASSSSASIPNQPRSFSLWSTLFSNTFSSLVHSILSTSFHSVHRQVVAALRGSLANAPPFREILPHEAHRNALHIATELDKALKKVSDDAHELLVHAEEREESERRLKQSLYVQTCEIMCRLLNELRRMLQKNPLKDYSLDKEDNDATKELIVGRLCFLLKFRLTSLPILLDPNSSPAVIASKAGGKAGMITIVELQSAFDIADIDGDGLVSYEESMESMEGAFSGTHFHGAEMVRDTMLLSSGGPDGSDPKTSGNSLTFTLSELALLSARGLRHKANGPDSALGIIQQMLNNIVESCFTKWASVALAPSLKICMVAFEEFISTASTITESEWKRLRTMNPITEDELLQQEIGDALEEGEKALPLGKEGIEVGSVSSFFLTYFISMASVLNKSVSPADSMQPFPSQSYAAAMGIESPSSDDTLMKLLRSCLVRESLNTLSISIHNKLDGNYDESVSSDEPKWRTVTASPSIQLLLDISFVHACYFKRNNYDFGGDKIVNVLEEEDSDGNNAMTVAQKSKSLFRELEDSIKQSLRMKESINSDDYLSIFEARHHTAFTSCGMFFTSLFGDETKKEPASVSESSDGFSSFSVSANDCSLLIPPLPSSRRFMLLPIQAEQSVKELQLIKNLEKERSDKAEAEKLKSAGSAAANAVSSSFGFFSSMLNKKK